MNKTIVGKCIGCQQINPLKQSLQEEIWRVKPDDKFYHGEISRAQTTGVLENVCEKCIQAANRAHGLPPKGD